MPHCEKHSIISEQQKILRHAERIRLRCRPWSFVALATLPTDRPSGTISAGWKQTKFQEAPNSAPGATLRGEEILPTLSLQFLHYTKLLLPVLRLTRKHGDRRLIIGKRHKNDLVPGDIHRERVVAA